MHDSREIGLRRTLTASFCLGRRYGDDAGGGEAVARGLGVARDSLDLRRQLARRLASPWYRPPRSVDAPRV